MQTALTRKGHRVALGVSTPVFENGELIGFYSYVFGPETYTTHEGIAHYAIRVFVPARGE